MSSASIAKSTGKKKRRRCPSYTHVGAKIHPKNGAKRYCVRKKNEHHPVVTETILLAPQEGYVVQHTEGTTVCLGGCMLPLLEVSSLQLGTLRRLQHELGIQTYRYQFRWKISSAANAPRHRRR